MKTSINSKIASCIYVLFAVVYIVGQIAEIPALLCNAFIALVGLVALGYCLTRKGLHGVHSYIVLLGGLFTMLMLLSMLYNGNAGILDTLWIWTYMGIAVLIYEGNIPSKVFWGVAYALLLFLLLYMLQGNSVDELLKTVSRNNISAYIIFFVLFGYLSEKKENEKKPMRYLPALLSLVITLWTGSRAGALSVAVLIGCIFLHNFFTIKGEKRSVILGICLLVAGVWAAIRFLDDYIVLFLDKMKYYGHTSARTEIWSEYLSGMFTNFWNLLLGVNMSGTEYPLLKFYGNNAHNAFLMLHAKYGLIGLLTGFVFMFKSMRKARENKHIVLMMVALVAGVRMFFDWIAFPGLYDVIFWLLVIYAIDKEDVSLKNGEHNEAG